MDSGLGFLDRPDGRLVRRYLLRTNETSRVLTGAKLATETQQVARWDRDLLRWPMAAARILVVVVAMALIPLFGCGEELSPEGAAKSCLEACRDGSRRCQDIEFVVGSVPAACELTPISAPEATCPDTRSWCGLSADACIRRCESEFGVDLAG